MRKIAIISDIHANVINFKKVLEDLEKRKIYEIIFLGDYILDGFANNEVLDIIKHQNTQAVVLGNKEEFFCEEDFDVSKYNTEQFRNVVYAYKNLSIENLFYIRNLPKYKILEIEGQKILCTHGIPTYTRENFREEKYEKFDRLIEDYDFNIYLYGHTHEENFEEYKNHCFINPSSLGMPLENKPGAKYGILTIDRANVEYEQIILEVDYKEVEKQYKNSDYYKEVGSWAKLSLMNLKTGYNYTGEFVSRVRKITNAEPGIFTESAPDDIWKREFEKFIKEKDIEKFI